MKRIILLVALGGFMLFGICGCTSPNKKSEDEAEATKRSEVANDTEATIRVTTDSNATTSFDAFFRTETDTLIFEDSVNTPKTFKIEEAQFTGYIRPYEGLRFNIEVTRSGLASRRTSSGPVEIVRNGSNISVRQISPENAE